MKRLILTSLIAATSEELGRWQVLAINVTEAELETAHLAWQAYRATTPEACFGLLGKNLSALPLLRPALLDLLEQLPSSATGLGATAHCEGIHPDERAVSPAAATPHACIQGVGIGMVAPRTRARSDAGVAGLDDELRTIRQGNLRARHAAYLRSRLSLTEFGKAVLAHQEDLSRHNPINRWWGGTELTNDRLWRWDPVLTAP
jgi:hypothetical protein